MGFLVQNCVDRLLAMVAVDMDDTNKPVGMAEAALGAALAACQEARTLNPALFAPRRRFNLAAPATVHFNLAPDRFTFSGLTGGPIPRAGCTVILDGEDYANQVATLTGSAGTLARPSLGASGSRSGTVYEDCWMPTKDNAAALFDRILGDVTANGRPIFVLADPSELTFLTRRTDYQPDYPITPRPPYGGNWPAYPFQLWNSQGVWGNGPYFTNELIEPGYREPFAASQVMGCWVEYNFTTTGQPPSTLIRFAPMADSAQVISLCIVSTPHLNTSDVGFPDGTQELLFMPLAVYQWMLTSFFKPDQSAASAIVDNYKRTSARLRTYRTLSASQPFRAPG